MMEEEECAKMLNHLQQYVPHLEKLISQLKDPKKKNRELQLSKLEGLHSMITDRKKKLKLDTLKKCEDVILKILQKVHPNIYKQLEQSEPRYTKFLCKDPPTEKTFLSNDELINSVRLQAARARLSEITTPASPSPPRDLTTIPPPIVIPTEKVVSRKLDNPPWERREDRLTCSSHTEIYKTEKPDIYRRAAESLSTVTNKDVINRLTTKVDMSVPPLSAEDLQELTEPDNLTVGELESLRDALQKKIVKEDMRASEAKSKHHHKYKEYEHKPTVKSRVEKVYKEPDTKFGSLLSKIDEQILEKKEDKRFKSDSAKKDKKHSKEDKKDKQPREEQKPIFKRLADKYNPKPRKNSVEVVDRPIEPPPSQMEKFTPPNNELDLYQSGNASHVKEKDNFHNHIKEQWVPNFTSPQREFPPPRPTGNTYMNTFIVQNNIPHQYPSNFPSQIPPSPKVFHPYDPIQSNEYELNKMGPVDYYPLNYQNQRAPAQNRAFPPAYGQRERPQFPESWVAPRREDPRLANRDPRLRSREQKEKGYPSGSAALVVQPRRKSVDEYVHSKFDSLYADKPRMKEETFVSPLDSLYTVGGETTGKGYGVQKFRIPKKKNDTDEVKSTEEVVQKEEEEIAKNEEEIVPAIEVVEEKIEEKKLEEDKKVEEKEVAKASPTEQSIIADFITNLIQGSDKKDILSALVNTLAGGVNDQQKKKFKRIQKIIESDSETEDATIVAPEVKKEEVGVVEEDEEEEEDQPTKNEKDEVKKVTPRKKKKAVKKVLQRKSPRKKPQDQQKVDEENLESVVETVGERIKNRRRNTNMTDAPKAKKSTELDKLHKDIKEMFICDGVLTATGKRMCRILKSDKDKDETVVLKPTKPKEEEGASLDSPKRRARTTNPKVVIEKTDLSKLVTSKCDSESDVELSDVASKTKTKNSRRKTMVDDSPTECVTPKSSSKRVSASRVKSKPNYAEVEEDASSVASSTEDKDETDTPIESTEKKSKKKKRGHNWAVGIITKKSNRKKIVSPALTPVPSEEPEPAPDPKESSEDPMPDPVIDEPLLHDQGYYFNPMEKSDCKLCTFKGKFIVQHYRTAHAFQEVLISRISPENAREAIDTSMEENYDEIEAVDLWETETKKKRFNYQCRFCKVFFKNESTDNFFDHTTSHTGEYRFHCHFCTFKTANSKSLRAHFHSSHASNYDQIGTITAKYPAPPNFSILFGYICQICHYVQLNKSALEDHVKNFHKDAKVYKINMSTVTCKPAEVAAEVPKDVPIDDEASKTDSVAEVVPVPAKSKEEDPTVFKYNAEDESTKLDEQKHEKMKEINENIVPKKKLSFDLLDKIKSRLDDKVEDKTEIEDSPAAENVTVASTKNVVEVKKEVEVKKLVGKPEAKTAVFLNKNSVPITNIIERLQEKLNIEAQPPPLIPISLLAARVDLNSEETQIQVGPVAAKKKSGYTLYMCYMHSCMFSSTTTEEFDAHCVNSHGNKQWNGFCNICDVNTGLVEVQEAFHHLLLAHKGDLTDEKKTDNEVKKYLRMRRLSGDKLSELKTKSMEPESPVISMSEESPFKIVNVRAEVEENEEENFFPFQISSVTTLTPEEDQALNTPEPKATAPIPIALQNSTYSLVLPVLSPLTTPPPKASPTKIIITSPKCTTAVASSPTRQQTIKTVVLKDIPMQPHEMLLPRKTSSAMKSLLTEQKLMHLYKCPKKVCTFSSNIKRLFEIHLRQHADFKPGVQIPCLYCNFKSDVSLYTVHCDARHGRCQYCCFYCFYRAVNQSYVEMHQERAHPKNVRKVLVAPLTQDALTTQVQNTLQPIKSTLPSYMCGQSGCNKKFIFSSDFAEHYDTAHGVGLYPCCYCTYIPTSGKDAITHMQAHNICRFHCRYCQYGGKTLYDVYHHLSFQHYSQHPKIIERIFIPDIKDLSKTSRDFDSEDPASYERLRLITCEFANYITTEARVEYASYTSNRVSKKVVPPKATQAETITLYKAPSVLGISPMTTRADGVVGMEMVDLGQNNTRADSPLVLNKYLQSSSTDLLNIAKNISSANTDITPISSGNRSDYFILQPDDINEPFMDITEDVRNKNDRDPLQLDQDQCTDASKCAHADDQQSFAETSSLNVTEEELSDFTTDEASFSSTNGKKQGLIGKDLFRCSFCEAGFDLTQSFKLHVVKCVELNKVGVARPYSCNHCNKCFKTVGSLLDHIRVHGTSRFACSLCDFKHPHQLHVRTHMKNRHSVTAVTTIPVDPNKNNLDEDDFVLRPKVNRQKSSDNQSSKDYKTTSAVTETVLDFGPEDVASVPLRPIFNREVKCSECGYATKVRANLIRHFQFHKTGKELPIPATAPVNPVPCLDKNEKMFDKMCNLALSSYTDNILRNLKSDNSKPKTVTELEEGIPMYVASNKRYTCGANNCDYLCLEESMLRSHLQALHSDETEYKCTHCHEDLSKEKGAINIEQILKHLRMHDLHLYKCHHCKFIHYLKHKVDRHVIDKHGDPMIVVVREMDHEPEENPILPEEIKESKPWRCGICKYRCSTKDDIVVHVYNKHDLDSQFKCALCQYRSNVKQVVSAHFEKEHPGQTVDVIDGYYEEEKSVVLDSTSFDTTPIWQREKNKFKHIRGIPIDESNRITKKSPTKVPVSEVDKGVESKKVAPSPLKKAKTLKEKKLELIKNEEDIIEIEDDVVIVGDCNAITTTEERDDKWANATLDEIEQLSIETLKQGNIVGSHGPLGKPNNKQYLCPICNTFKTRKLDDITHHLYKELSYPRFVCTNCGLTGITYNFLKKHSEKKHLGLPEAIHPMSPDSQIEDWVSKVLLVQGRLIAENESGTVTSTTINQSKKRKVVAKTSEITLPDSSSTLRDSNAKPLYPHQCRYCNYNCKAAGDLRKHERRHWVQKPLKCGYCDTEGVSNYEIQQHSKRAHPNVEPMVVSVPMPSVPTIKPIARKRKLPRNESTITSSSDSTSKVTILEQHVSYTSNDDEDVLELICSYCPSRFSTKSDMQTHWDIVHKSKGLSFKFKEVLNEASSKKGSLNYKCSYCAFVGHLEAAKRHFKVVHPNLSLSLYRYKCEYCEKYFRNIDKIRIHYKTVHNDTAQTCFDIKDPDTPLKDLVCQYCNMDFDDHFELEDHHNTYHSHLDLIIPSYNSTNPTVIASASVVEKKNYKCPAVQCTYFSNNYSCIRDHVRCHAKPFQCGHCPLRGIYPSFVKSHHHREHPDLDFKCVSSAEGSALYNTLKQNILTLNKNGEYEVIDTKHKKLNVMRPIHQPLPKKPKLFNVARKSTTQVEVKRRKETARKSTTQILRPKIIEKNEEPKTGFSYYGDKPDLAGAENLNTSVMLGSSHLKINFTQLQGLFEMFPTVSVVDIKNNVDQL